MRGGPEEPIRGAAGGLIPRFLLVASVTVGGGTEGRGCGARTRVAGGGEKKKKDISRPIKARKTRKKEFLN